MEAINSIVSEPIQPKDTCETTDKPQGPPKQYTYTFSTQPLETDLKKLLTQVTGCTDIQNLTEVKMKVVTRQAGLHRLADYTPHLSVLILDGSCVSSFRDLGSCLKSLTVLSVVRCNLKHLDGAWGFRRLEKLNARDNFITDPSPCAGVQKLAVLDLSNNDITDLSYFAFLGSCKHLRELNIAQNNFEDYGDEIRSLLPQLRVIDGQEVERGEEYVSEEGSTEESELSSDGDNLISLSDDDDTEKPDTPPDSVDSEDDTKCRLQNRNVCNPSEDENEVPTHCDVITEKITDEGSPFSRPSTADRPGEPACLIPAEISSQPRNTVADRELNTTIIDKSATHELPSKLASGRVICGNLAVSLRTRNPTKNLFTLPQKKTDMKIEEIK